MGALHCLSPRRSSERYQCNFSAAPGADVGTASHRPSQQLISRGRSPNETFFLKRTMDVHWSASCQALAAAPPPSRGVQAFETEPHGRAAVPRDPGVHTVGRRQTGHVAPGGRKISALGQAYSLGLSPKNSAIGVIGISLTPIALSK